MISFKNSTTEVVEEKSIKRVEGNCGKKTQSAMMYTTIACAFENNPFEGTSKALCLLTLHAEFFRTPG